MEQSRCMVLICMNFAFVRETPRLAFPDSLLSLELAFPTRPCCSATAL
jgi:hypothetical protein